MDEAVFIKLHSTSGGDSEAELKELMVSPSLLPSGASAVTTATPVAKRPSASRKLRSEKGSTAAGDRLSGGKGRFTGQANGKGLPSKKGLIPGIISQPRMSQPA